MQYSSSPAWIPRPAPGQLAGDEIHVWLASLADADCRAEWLDARERGRLEDRTPTLGRDLFCASRSMLRRLLAGYLELRPDAVELEIEPGGKPVVRGQALHFNLSHARDTLLLALSAKRPLGVDLEYPRPVKNLAQVAQRVFSVQEIQALQAAEDPRERFFDYWTRFEATQKCAGHGIFGARQHGDRVRTHGFAIGPARACVAWQADETTRSEPDLRYFRYAPASD